MAQDAKIMAAALRRYQADQEARKKEWEDQVRSLYRRLPRLELIDRELRSTAAKIVLAAFSETGDPDRAVAELERRNLELQRERAELLVGAGYPYDCLDEKPACPICQDAGILPDGGACRCLMAYYAREQNRRLSRLLDLGSQSFDTFSFDWYSDQVWEQYGRSPLENMEMIREICGNYAHTFGPKSGNMLFTGAPGLGKTFLSACIAREVSDLGFSVVYDTAAHVFQRFECEKFGRESALEENAWEDVGRYLHCDLLIMDDLGTEMRTDFVQAAFYRIVNDRLLHRRKTVLSTNLDMDGIARRYGEAVLSRLRGEYQLLRFFGEDIRLLKRK